MRVALVLGLCFYGASALAGRPFVTEDAGVLEASACEWENVAARAQVPDAPRATLLSTQVGCGVGSQWQFAVNTSRARSGDERATGLGLAGKVGLWTPETGPAWTLAWGSSWSRLRGAGTDWDGASAQVVVSQEWGAWSAHGNLGRSYARLDRQSVTTWAALVERRLSESIDVGAELFGEGSQRAGYGVGARWRVAEGWTLDASWARSGAEPRERWVTVGFKLEF